MAADLGQPPPPGSKDPKDYVTTKILKYFHLKLAYELQAKIAAGNFGKVFKAVHHGASDHADRSGLGKTGRDTLVAVKMIEIDKQPTIMKTKFLPREMDALKAVKHENAVKIFDIMETGTPGKDQATWFFMEFAPNGDIFTFIMKVRKAPLSNALAGYWTNQILSALEALHERYGMAHRDLKLENVMLGPRWEAKVADFGFACSIYGPQKDFAATKSTVKSETFCGTLQYQCIQILKHQPYDAAKADVWAMGVMLYNMITMKICFINVKQIPGGRPTEDRQTQIDSIEKATHKQRPIWATLDPDCQVLIDKMLTIDEAERPTAARCRKSKWATRYSTRPAELDHMGGGF